MGTYRPIIPRMLGKACWCNSSGMSDVSGWPERSSDKPVWKTVTLLIVMKLNLMSRETQSLN